MTGVARVDRGHTVGRKVAGELTALPGLARDDQLGVMPCQYVFDDGEPESRPAAVALPATADAEESLREARDVLFIDTLAGVPHRQVRAFARR